MTRHIIALSTLASIIKQLVYNEVRTIEYLRRNACQWNRRVYCSGSKRLCCPSCVRWTDLWRLRDIERSPLCYVQFVVTLGQFCALCLSCCETGNRAQSPTFTAVTAGTQFGDIKRVIANTSLWFSNESDIGSLMLIINDAYLKSRR